MLRVREKAERNEGQKRGKGEKWEKEEGKRERKWERQGKNLDLVRGSASSNLYV